MSTLEDIITLIKDFKEEVTKGNVELRKDIKRDNNELKKDIRN